MSDSPFVGRADELEALTMTIVDDTPESLLRGLRADGTLTDDQTKVVGLVASAVLFSRQDATREEVLETLTTERKRLTTEEFPTAPELCRIGRVVLDFVRQSVGEREVDGWATLEAEYGVTREECRLLRAAVVKTGLSLFALSVIIEEIEDHASEALGESLQLDGDASVEDWIVGSLLRGFDSPMRTAFRALKSPTVDQLEELSDMWAKLEVVFETNEHPVFAAVCREMRETVVAPITGGATKTRVGLELKNAVDLDAMAVRTYEPIATLITVTKAVKRVTADDPEREET